MSVVCVHSLYFFLEKKKEPEGKKPILILYTLLDKIVFYVICISLFLVKNSLLAFVEAFLNL